MESARNATGLSDFGNDWFLAPLRQLVDDVNREAGLVSPESSAGARIQGALADRLQLEQYFKDHPEAAQEPIDLVYRTFLSTTYDSMMPIHGYGHWQAEQDHEPAIRDLYRFMQVIQHQRVARGEVRRPWVFKTPHYVMGALAGLLKVWPDVKLVMTHRDVGDVLPSYCSMCASLSVNSSTSYRKEEQGAHWTRRFRDGLNRLEAIRATLPEGQVIDVAYRDTVTDPQGTGEKILAALGYAPDADDRLAMQQTIAANGREARPKHKYSAADFGLTPEGIAQDFADYHKKYLS